MQKRDQSFFAAKSPAKTRRHQTVGVPAVVPGPTKSRCFKPVVKIRSRSTRKRWRSSINKNCRQSLCVVHVAHKKCLTCLMIYSRFQCRRKSSSIIQYLNLHDFNFPMCHGVYDLITSKSSTRFPPSLRKMWRQWQYMELSPACWQGNQHRGQQPHLVSRFDTHSPESTMMFLSLPWNFNSKTWILSCPSWWFQKYLKIWVKMGIFPKLSWWK